MSSLVLPRGPVPKLPEVADAMLPLLSAVESGAFVPDTSQISIDTPDAVLVLRVSVTVSAAAVIPVACAAPMSTEGVAPVMLGRFVVE